MHPLSAFVMIVLSVVGVIVRFAAIEPLREPLLSGIILVILLHSGYSGLQVHHQKMASYRQ